MLSPAGYERKMEGRREGKRDREMKRWRGKSVGSINVGKGKGISHKESSLSISLSFYLSISPSLLPT
jgi:hypothetical protein